MGLYLNQNETRTQLSSKVAADLSQRLNKRAIEGGKEQQDLILKNKHPTTGGGIFWSIVVGAVLVAVLIYIIFFYGA